VRDKFFLKSRSVWGILITFAPMLASLVGVEPPPNLPAIADAGLSLLNSVNELIGFGLIAWGRYAAPGVRLVVARV